MNVNTSPDWLTLYPSNTGNRGDRILSADLAQNHSPKLAYLVSGIAKKVGVAVSSKSGIPVTLAVYGPGAWLGLEVCHAINLFSYDCLTRCHYVELTRDQFYNLGNEPLIMALSQSTDLIERHEWELVNRQQNLKIRLAGHLYRMRRDIGDTEIPLTQTDLANLLGVHRSMIKPALDALQKYGLLTHAYRKLKLAAPGKYETYFKDNSTLNQFDLNLSAHQ